MSTDELAQFRRFLPDALVKLKSESELREIRRAVWRLFDLLPSSVADLRTEVDLRYIAPWFMRSLAVEGDLCEFGCFQGTLSIKLAFALRALGLSDRTVYAFDTFEGFAFGDPKGGLIEAGAYNDIPGIFSELSKWSAVIPLKPVKGDARATCSQLYRPLSFVWLDMDFDVLMAPVLDRIWPLIGPGTVIGIDDVGRPDTPSVQPWVEAVVAEGRLVELDRVDEVFIRFFRANKG